MALAERRKIKELQDITLPEREREIEEICGAAIPYQVDWDSLAEDGAALNFLDNIACHRLNMALRMICIDEMGKQAVRDGLKLVKLKNVGDMEARSIHFDAGVLEMRCPYALGTQGMLNDSEIRDALLAKL
ncbi:hypothetical protein IVG45_13105 [Methylomonas sp. LL1]|uniref:hypothetical protein n=1 Tax=Methylomonas sp. LL1 TaxID=2785785 RepID=UPI0018C439FE|nr:hypothetical protein [Methylomonas sp. LL1]QPK61802.1 hypothetical protein IVG45_13105 [Methylomonas sp. LL1]